MGHYFLLMIFEKLSEASDLTILGLHHSSTWLDLFRIWSTEISRKAEHFLYKATEALPYIRKELATKVWSYWEHDLAQWLYAFLN